MDYPRAVRYYAITRYPTSWSLFRYRSSESQAAVALLDTRVNTGDGVGLQRAVNYLLGGAAPGGVDAAVTGLARISATGRLHELLLDVQELVTIPQDFTEVHLSLLWAKPTFALTGLLLDSKLHARSWLSYFYKERQRINALSNDDRAWLVQLLCMLFTRPNALDLHASGTRVANSLNANDFLTANPLPARPDGTETVFKKLDTRTPDNTTRAYRVRQDVVREGLIALMHSGFVPVAECDDEHDIVGPPGNAAVAPFSAWGNAGDTVARATESIRAFPNDTFGWRGDSRTFAQLSEVGGLWSKAASENYAEPNKMRKSWHPFSDPAVRKYLYYRVNQNDNCLYSAVSITPAVAVQAGQAHGFRFNQPKANAFEINVTFPQLSEIPDAERKLVRVTYQDITSGASGAHHCYVDEVRLYLCKFRQGKPFVDTRYLQITGGTAGFPEIAVRGVPLENVRGYIVFIRVHHGGGDAEGFTAIPVEDRSLNRRPGDVNGTALYDNACNQFEIAWGSAGPVPPTRVWAGVYRLTGVGNMAVGLNGRIAHYSNY